MSGTSSCAACGDLGGVSSAIESPKAEFQLPCRWAALQRRLRHIYGTYGCPTRVGYSTRAPSCLNLERISAGTTLQRVRVITAGRHRQPDNVNSATSILLAQADLSAGWSPAFSASLVACFRASAATTLLRRDIAAVSAAGSQHISLAGSCISGS